MSPVLAAAHPMRSRIRFWAETNAALRHGRARPHRRQDKRDAGEKFSPSPCGRGLGGGRRRPEVEPATYAETAICAGATPPPSPLPQGEWEYVAPASAYPDAYWDTPGHDGEGTVPKVQSCGVWHHAAGKSSNHRRNPPGSARARQRYCLLRVGLTGDTKQSKCLDRIAVVISLNLA
jgi:hypothetical protein